MAELLARVPLRLVGVLAVVVGLVAGCLSLGGPSGSRSSDSRPSTAAAGLEVGDCISHTEYAAENIDAPAIDCAAPDAVFQLVTTGGPDAVCPDGKGGEESNYGVLFNNARTYCFIPNIAVGTCYSIDVEAKMFVPEDCASPNADTKIASIIPGTTDVSVCGADKGVAFPEPQRVYCVVQP